MRSDRHRIQPASMAELDGIRQLFAEYQLAEDNDLCFDRFAEEVSGLPGDYAEPAGCLLMASIDGELAGCIAMRAMDSTQAELKRLYVRPAYRGRRLGLGLIEAVVERASQAGYASLCLETLPSMVAAQQLYRSIGFERVEKSAANADVIFLRRCLNGQAVPSAS